MTTETMSATESITITEAITIREYVCTLTESRARFTIIAACPGGGGYLSGVYSSWPTREDAIAHAQRVIAHHLASEIAHLPTRAEYEAACKRQGYVPFSDAEITTSYNIENGNYSMPQYSANETVPMLLAQARLRTLKTETDAKTEMDAIKTETSPVNSSPVATTTLCPICGLRVDTRTLMYASMGTACPNCYDDMEDEE